MMPPPNVTGNLHIGHALNTTIQDILIRYHRMKGDVTLWLPGTDHAGIATQNVVEKSLLKEGLTRHNLGREKFIEKVWEWVKNYGGNIKRQLRRIGASCDWSRERFTLDEGFSLAVKTAFVELYKKGLIYRGDYIVNWCPRCASVIADDEVEYKEQDSYLYYLKYSLENSEEYVVVATTRPETILADSALAFNPKDKRYSHLKEKKAVLPLVGRKLPFVESPLVNPDFGTGLLKVTPGHDVVDWEIGKQHSLPIYSVIGFNGKMNQEAGKDFEGLSVKQAREKIVGMLEDQGFLLKKENYTHSVGHCYRCNTIIEPLVSTQWFVKMKPLAEKALKSLEANQPQFFPSRFKKIYKDWLLNIKDWCISRQLWWGHQIPVYYCQNKNCGNIMVDYSMPQKCPVCGGKDIVQDSDVLDTWFSSSLWPFGTLGWPLQTKDFKYFYPTSILVTAPDIIFFWVARMIMMGLEFTGKMPFQIVYLHGLVRDEKGQKMSKSKGNVIDPMVMIERYSADALRMGLIAGVAPGHDVPLSEGKIKGFRNFGNKIWNATRFILLALEKELQLKEKIKDYATDISKLQLKQSETQKILNEVEKLTQRVTNAIESFRLSDAALEAYHFFWDRFCDEFIEYSKKYIWEGSDEEKIEVLSVLLFVLKRLLVLLHPFIPFVTEWCWQQIEEGKDYLISQPWPKIRQL
jgi:valyl-tRNA synthetase